MKFFDGLKYMFKCMTSFLILTALEIFLFRPLVDLIGTDFWTRFYVYSVLIVFINPLLTYVLIDVVLPQLSNIDAN